MTVPALLAKSPAERLVPARPLTLAGVPDGAEGLAIADLTRAVAARKNPPAISLAVVCRDGPRMATLSRALSFFAPDIELLEFPAWDCLPYDRVSPHPAVVAQRVMTLARLARVAGRDHPAVLLTTVNAILQRVPERALLAKQSLSIAPGNLAPMAGIIHWLELNGFSRAATVRESGDYAVRGGIVDLFAPGMDEPVRLDFFGDTLEAIRSFNPETQRTTSQLRALDLVPVSEFQLTSDTIRQFRTGYVAEFGAAGPDDALYEAVSEGRRHAGMEHWLPLFHRHMETLSDYVPATPLALEPLAEEAAHERLAQIADYFQARKDALAQSAGGVPYKPLPPDRLYLAEAEWRAHLDKTPLARLTPFAAPEQTGASAENVITIGAQAGHNFATERSAPGANVFEAVVKHVGTLQSAGKRVLIALWSEGSRERMGHVLAEHGLHNLVSVASAAAGRACGAWAGIRFRDRRHSSHHRAGHSRRATDPRAPGVKAGGEFHRRGDKPRHWRSRRPCRSRHRPLFRPARHRSRRRAARLSRNPLCRRRQALPARREHRTPLALRLRTSRRRARPARRHRLAVAQGADEKPHPRDRRRTHQGRRRATIARGAAACGRRRRL
jgi:transcription-repair coupling factor (superfamily II helicase)